MVVEEHERDSRGGRFLRLHALEHVANRPIAHHVLEALQAANVDELVIVAPAGVADEVEDCVRAGWVGSAAPVRHLTCQGRLDLAGAMRIVAPIVGEARCILHTANGLLEEPLTSSVELISGDGPTTIVVVHQGAASHRRLNSATQDMLHLAELDPKHAALGITGVWLFGPGALRLASSTRWESPGGVDLTSVSARISEAAGRLDVRPVESWRAYTGDPLDLLELNRIALDGLHAEQRRPAIHGNQIEGRVWIHEDASVQSSVIVGPTVIGSGARICDAYIGPYTSVGAGARIEGAEIERSIISAGASILHVGGRIASSVVGREARIFRDFSLPRALRLRVGDGTEVALC